MLKDGESDDASLARSGAGAAADAGTDSHTLLEAIFEAIPDILGIQNPDQTIIRYNSAGYRFLGLTPEEVAGRKCYELIGRKTPCDVCATREALRTRRPAQVVKYVPECGLWLDARSYPVLDGSGNVTQIIEHLRDVTREKQAEEERGRLEARLRQAEKMEAVGQLAGGVAHDFNNLLTAIQGNAELLQDDFEAETDQGRILAQILQAGGQAADLTRQLLAFARTGAVQSVVVDLHEMLEQARGLLTRSIGTAIEIEMHLEAERPHLVSDPSHLETAVMNLAVNARDAMPEGGTLSFRTRNVTVDRARHFGNGHLEPGEYVELLVTDTGTGMDARTQARIFEPFFTTKGKGKGTGLGLACVYGCVTRHRGAVAVHSAPGKGAEFRLVFPVAAAEETPAAERTPRETGITGGPVLLVEDEALVREYLARMLERLGFEVTACGDGEEAVRVFRERRGAFELVILDVLMPRMSGLPVLRALRRIEPEVRVLVCSGYADEDTVNSLLEEGAADFLPKPFDRETLSRTLQACLRGRNRA
ncbi:MAG: response regulator [Lentisphaerae bacterium]|nr:response regulator [Lentisphaerota bacterium]